MSHWRRSHQFAWFLSLLCMWAVPAVATGRGRKTGVWLWWLATIPTHPSSWFLPQRSETHHAPEKHTDPIMHPQLHRAHSGLQIPLKQEVLQVPLQRLDLGFAYISTVVSAVCCKLCFLHCWGAVVFDCKSVPPYPSGIPASWAFSA